MITKDQAEEMLNQLTEYYQCPVMPVDRYCRCLETWAEVASKAGEISSDFVMQLHTVYKSNLLYRLIYLGEELRTTPCPVHKGVWSGWALSEKNNCACLSGVNITGWLPNEPKD
jgi:hypothetical protein